jgi:hypothetical protein
MLSTSTQLGLSFDRDVLHTWTDRATGASEATDMAFAIRLTPTGAVLRLSGPWPAGEEPSVPRTEPHSGVLWEARVQMFGPARARVSAAPEGREAEDDGQPLDLAFPALGWARLAARALPRAAALAFVEAMERSLDQVTGHLRRLAVAPAVAAARGFPRRDGLRWSVYQAAARDFSGRVARLAVRCPGVLLLCKGLRDHGAADAARRVLDAAARGARLAMVLRVATVAWAEASGGVPPERLAAQQARVRAAGAGVDPRALWRCPAALPAPPAAATGGATGAATDAGATLVFAASS